MMKEWLLDRTTIVWLILILASSLSWFMGANQNQILLNVIIILITFVKVRLVITHFMEVRSAPQALRILCDAWMAILCISMLMLYFPVLPWA